MAGVVEWFGYESDDGLVYSVKMDYSNVSVRIGGSLALFGFLPEEGRARFKLPADQKPRYIIAVSLANQRIRRRFVISTKAAWRELLAQPNPFILASEYPKISVPDDFSNVTQFAISSFIGEEILRIPNQLLIRGGN
jgi:hypothetical protein